jgi:hypothetical protein
MMWNSELFVPFFVATKLDLCRTFFLFFAAKIPIFRWFQSKATENKAILIDFLLLAFKEDGDFDVLLQAQMIFGWR